MISTNQRRYISIFTWVADLSLIHRYSGLDNKIRVDTRLMWNNMNNLAMLYTRECDKALFVLGLEQQGFRLFIIIYSNQHTFVECL